jgi:PPOX class probable F420-dependent enzyme
MAELTNWARMLLDGRHYATLATHDADGGIHLTPVWYLFRDGQFFVATAASTRKAKNVAARPTASVLVDTRTPGGEQWVSGAGPVTIVRGDDARQTNRAIHERYLTAAAFADPVVGAAFAGGDDLTLSIRPATWRFWRAADFDAQVFGGVLGETPEKWFLPVD